MRFDKLAITLVIAFIVSIAAPAWAQDSIDLKSAHILGSPADIASWASDVRITRLDFASPAGLSFQRTGADWPNFTPPGWTGPIQYTVWACAPIDGWTCAGFIQMWRDRPGTGAPLPSFYQFWWGDQSGEAINHPFGAYAPQPGDQMAFFLSAGDARGNGGVSSTRERSNVVTVALPVGDTGSFPFSGGPGPVPSPAPIPQPTPQPQPVPTPAPIPSTDISPILNQLNVLMTQQIADTAQIRADIKSFRDDVTSTWHNVLGFVIKYVPLAAGTYLLGTKK